MLRLHQIFILATLYLNFGLLEGLPIANETQREVLRKLYHKLRVDVEDFGLALNFTNNIRPDESEISEGTGSEWSFRGVVDAIIGREQTDEHKNGAVGNSEIEQTKKHGVSETINDIINNLNEVREIVVGNCSESEKRDPEVKINPLTKEVSQKVDTLEEKTNGEQEDTNGKSSSIFSVSNEESQGSDEDSSEGKNSTSAGASGEQSADSVRHPVAVTSTPESESSDEKENAADITAENSESSDDSSGDESENDSNATTATPSSEEGSENEGGSEGEEDEEIEVTTTEWPFRVSFREIGAHLGLLGKFPKPPSNDKEAVGTTESSVTTAIYDFVDKIKSSLGYGSNEGEGEESEFETSIKAAGLETESDETSEKSVTEIPNENVDKSNSAEKDESSEEEKQITSPENLSATKATTENSNESEIEIGADNDDEGAGDLTEQEGTTEKIELTTAATNIESEFSEPIHTTSAGHEAPAVGEKTVSSDEENSSLQNKGDQEHQLPDGAEDENVGSQITVEDSAENSKSSESAVDTVKTVISVDLAAEDDGKSSGGAESDEEKSAVTTTNTPPHEENEAKDSDSSDERNSSGASILSETDENSQISADRPSESIKSSEETDNNLYGGDSITEVPEFSTISSSAINAAGEISNVGLSSVEAADGKSAEVTSEVPEKEEKSAEQSEDGDDNNEQTDVEATNVKSPDNEKDDDVDKEKSSEGKEEDEEQKSTTTESIGGEAHSFDQETTIAPLHQEQVIAIYDGVADVDNAARGEIIPSEGENAANKDEEDAANKDEEDAANKDEENAGNVDVSDEDEEILETIPEETEADLAILNKNDYTGEILTPEIIVAEKERAAQEETNLTETEDEREETKSSERTKGRDTNDDLILIVGADEIENEEIATEATKLATEVPQEETDDKLADINSRRVITHSEEMEYLEKTQSLDKGQSSYPSYDSVDDEEKAVFGDTISRIETIPVRVKDVFEELLEKQKEQQNENASDNEEKSAVDEIKDGVGSAFGKVSTWLDKSDGQKSKEVDQEDGGIFGGIISEVGAVAEKAKDAIDELLEMKKADEEEKAQTKENGSGSETEGADKNSENTEAVKNDGGYGSWFKQINDFVEKETESSTEKKETTKDGGASSTASSTEQPEGEESLAGVIKTKVDFATDKVVSWLHGKSEEKKESGENDSSNGIIATGKNTLEDGGTVVELAEGEEKDKSEPSNNEDEKLKSEEKSDGGFGSWFKHVTEAIKNETKSLVDSTEASENEDKSSEEIVNPTQDTAAVTEVIPELEELVTENIELEEEQESEEKSVLSVITTSVDSAVDKVTSWFGEKSEEKKESSEADRDSDSAGILGGIISAAEKAYEREMDTADKTPESKESDKSEQINNDSKEVNETSVIEIDPEAADEKVHSLPDKILSSEPIVDLIASSEDEGATDNFTVGTIHSAEKEAEDNVEKADEAIKETVPVKAGDDSAETDNANSETSDVQEIAIINAQSNEDENVPTYDDISVAEVPANTGEPENATSENVEKIAHDVETADENLNQTKTASSEEENKSEEILAPVLLPETAENELASAEKASDSANSESGLGLVTKAEDNESGSKSEESVVGHSENINITDYNKPIGVVVEEKLENAEKEGGESGLGLISEAEEVEGELKSAESESGHPGHIGEHIVTYDYDEAHGAVAESTHDDGEANAAKEGDESGLGLVHQVAKGEEEQKSEEAGHVHGGKTEHIADYDEVEQDIQTTDVHRDDGKEVEVDNPSGEAGSEETKIELPMPPVDESDIEETENVKYEHNLGSNLISPGTDNVEPSMLSMKQFHDNKGNPEPRVNVTFNAPKLKGVYDMYIDRKGRRCSEFTELPLDVEYLREVFVNLGYSNFQLPSLGVNLNELADKAVFFKDLDDNSILCGTLTINHR